MDVRLLIGLVALIGLASGAWGSDVREYALAREGKPLVSIIVPKGASPVITSAADDLAACIEKASGARPPVDREGSPTAECAIYLGETDACRDAGLPPSGMKDEGYAIVPREGSILICGSTDYGTANGVYGFLQDVMGVRWFMPGEMWEVVPKADPLVVKVAAVRSEPDFSFRIWSGLHGEECSLWGIRNRLTTYRQGIKYYGFGHNLSNIIRPSRYGQEHPEYFPEINGKRFVPDTDSVSVGQLCFTNPDVIALTVKAGQDYFARNPDATQFSLCINDSLSMCTCKDCAALDEPYRMHRTGRQYSDSYYHYVTEVAKGLAKTHPDKTVGCYAYWPVELPPRHIERLPDNVVVALTQDTSQHFDPEYRAIDRKVWLQWTEVASHVVKYDYYGLGWYSPRYFPHLAAEDLKFLHKTGATGFYCEAAPYLAVTAPQLYMATQLLWNADQDPDAVLDEYMTGLFGEAAPTMEQFYSLMERIWMKERPGMWFQGLDWIDSEVVNFDAPAMTQGLNLLHRAYDESSGPARERIDYILRFYRFSFLIPFGYESAVSMRDLPLDTLSDAEHLAAEMKRTISVESLAERTWAATVKDDPLHTTGYYRDNPRFWNKFGSWQNMIVREEMNQLVRLSAWTETNMAASDRNAFLDALVHDLEKVRFRNAIDFRSDIPRAGGIRIDGDSKDWMDAQWTAVLDGEGGTTADFALSWDADCLYFACNVNDSLHAQSKNDATIWSEDSVQIGIDTLHDAWQVEGYGQDDYEYGFALTKTGPLVWCWQGDTGKVDDIPLQVVHNGDKTFYEASIPWTRLEPLRPGGGEVIGLNVLVFGFDGTERSSFEWGAGRIYRKDPRLFYPVRLSR